MRRIQSILWASLALGAFVSTTAMAGLVTVPIGVVIESDAPASDIHVHIFLADANGDEIWSPGVTATDPTGPAIEYSTDFNQSPFSHLSGTSWCAEVDAEAVGSDQVHFEFLQQQANGSQERLWGDGSDLAGGVTTFCMPATLVK